MDIESIKEKVKRITSSSDYEGNFGDTLDDVSLILSDAPHLEKYIPHDYIQFMKKIGYGELDASFYFEDGPYTYKKIYTRTISELEGMYVIATDLSEYVYAFDTNNNYIVVEIDASGVISNNLGDFNSFINKELNAIIECVVWRENNK